MHYFFLLIKVTYLIMKNLQVIIIVTIIYSMVYGIELTRSRKQVLRRVHNECQSNPATHVDEEVLRKYNYGEQVDVSLVSPHIFCMSEKMGLMDKHGYINKKNVRKVISHDIPEESKIEEVLGKCAVQKQNAEDTAIDLLKCLQEHTGRTGIRAQELHNSN